MLGDSPMSVVLLATDMAASKDFYANKVGLKIANDGADAVSGTKDEQTQAAWRVKDIRAELAELRKRGVKIEDYDTPGLKTANGIADIGFAWMAWFIDPGKNCVGILQVK